MTLYNQLSNQGTWPSLPKNPCSHLGVMRVQAITCHKVWSWGKNGCGERPDILLRELTSTSSLSSYCLPTFLRPKFWPVPLFFLLSRHFLTCLKGKQRDLENPLQQQTNGEEQKNPNKGTHTLFQCQKLWHCVSCVIPKAVLRQKSLK